MTPDATTLDAPPVTPCPAWCDGTGEHHEWSTECGEDDDGNEVWARHHQRCSARFPGVFLGRWEQERPFAADSPGVYVGEPLLELFTPGDVRTLAAELLQLADLLEHELGGARVDFGKRPGGLL